MAVELDELLDACDDVLLCELELEVVVVVVGDERGSSTNIHTNNSAKMTAAEIHTKSARPVFTVRLT